MTWVRRGRSTIEAGGLGGLVDLVFGVVGDEVALERSSPVDDGVHDDGTAVFGEPLPLDLGDHVVVLK